MADKMIVYYKSKKIIIKNLRKLSNLGKITGLMFRSKSAFNLLFNFDKNTNMPIHSFFVFYDFLAIWTDENNNAVDFKIVRPFTSIIKSKRPFRKLIELPINESNKAIIKFFVGKGKV